VGSGRPATPIPRHDPTAPNALVMKRPSAAPKGKQLVDVIVDPYIGRHLREHQRDGVKFLYECVMGMRSHDGQGAILADEMGLGKSLQTIALLWTLLKQNPVYEDPPVIRKALIVCPVSLINNWRKEFRRWLGLEKIGVYVADGKNIRLTDFTRSKAYSVMIIGYEKLRTVYEDLKKGSGVDIIIADEGHRLKTVKNKCIAAIKELNTEKVVVLTGTPLQNDLSEFFVMVDLVNPGLFGKYNTFKREFEDPIIRGRQPEASLKEKEKEQARKEDLKALTDLFILRRSADLLSKYLPRKTEYVLLCKPTKAQATIYRSILSSPIFGAALGSNEMALQLISILKKVCNSPSLLKTKGEDEKASEIVLGLIANLPSTQLSPSVSSKIRVVDSLLHLIRATTNEKVVLVSNYTATLDILGQLLTSNSYKFLRLDGSTPASKRQSLVDRFNNTDAKQCFAFLLSAKAGGMGLNLVGASRLILFDIDWNPAIDAQAMARIHRDGQKRPCWIYRLLTKGALDEKIYQRQLSKQGLADAVVDNKASASSFTQEELRDLFSLDEREECQTHTLLGCECGGEGKLPAPNDDYNALGEMSKRTSSDSQTKDDLDDETSSLPELSMLIKASQVNMEEQERRIKKRALQARRSANATNIRSLMRYLHIDVERMLAQKMQKVKENEGVLESTDDLLGRLQEDIIDDNILMEVLEAKDNRVSFAFARSTI
jgi:DNA repair and recombination protein RAD54B